MKENRLVKGDHNPIKTLLGILPKVFGNHNTRNWFLVGFNEEISAYEVHDISGSYKISINLGGKDEIREILLKPNNEGGLALVHNSKQLVIQSGENNYQITKTGDHKEFDVVAELSGADFTETNKNAAQLETESYRHSQDPPEIDQKPLVEFAQKKRRPSLKTRMWILGIAAVIITVVVLKVADIIPGIPSANVESIALSSFEKKYGVINPAEMEGENYSIRKYFTKVSILEQDLTALFIPNMTLGGIDVPKCEWLSILSKRELNGFGEDVVYYEHYSNYRASRYFRLPIEYFNAYSGQNNIGTDTVVFDFLPQYIIDELIKVYDSIDKHPLILNYVTSVEEETPWIYSDSYIYSFEGYNESRETTILPTANFQDTGNKIIYFLNNKDISPTVDGSTIFFIGKNWESLFADILEGDTVEVVLSEQYIIPQKGSILKLTEINSVKPLK